MNKAEYWKNMAEAANELFHAAKSYLEDSDKGIYNQNIAFIRLKQAVKDYNETRCNVIIGKIKEAWKPELQEQHVSDSICEHKNTDLVERKSIIKICLDCGMVLYK